VFSVSVIAVLVALRVRYPGMHEFKSA